MSRRVLTFVLLGVLVLPYFVGLGRPDLWDANETLYAEPPREAIETGAWLVPTMNYEPWFVKPPGVTWATIPFYALLGASELAGRLPMALAAALTVLLTFDVARRLASWRAGLLAGAVLATTAKHFMFSRQLAGDVFLTTCFAVAGWGYVRWLLSDGARRGGLWVAGFTLGVGVLMKGPVALVLAAGLFVLDRLLARRVRPAPRLRPVGPLALALAVAAPWFVYMAASYDGFVHEYFLRNNALRFLTDLYGARGPLFLPMAFLGDALPWSLPFLGAVVVFFAEGRGGRWRADARLLPLLWVLVVFGFFSASTGKRSVYLLPAYPAVAVVLGVTIDRLVRAQDWRRARWIVLPLVGVATGATAVAIVLTVRLPPLRDVGIATSALLLSWTALLLWAWRGRRLLRAAEATFATLAVLAFGTAIVLGRIGEVRPARAFAERIAREAAPGDVSGRYAVGLQSLTFYGHRPFFSLRDPDELRATCRRAPRAWVVLEDDDLHLLADDPGLVTRVVDEGTYAQISLPALLGTRPLERRLLLVLVTSRTGSG